MGVRVTPVLVAAGAAQMQEFRVFSPFDTALETLSAPDLERLRDVAEGWFVEYKSRLSNAADIARSIAALANTHGGWVFYGVQELSKEEPVAGALPGIPKADADAALQSIRQAVAQNMNPAAHFDARVVSGDGGSLAADRVVVCVRVPRSLAAPHVHRSGRIYRRVADGSEPRPESDRHLLDQLFRRSDDLRQEFERWVHRDPEFSEGEGKVPYLRLMMVVDPWRDESPWLEIEARELKELFAATPGLVSAVPFDTLYTSARGYVARQVSTNDPHNLGLTWRLQETLVSDLYLPLNFYTAANPWQLLEHLDGYECASRFIRMLEKRNYSSPRIVDLNMLFNLLVGIVETQRRLLARAGWTKSYFVKARLLNVWRTVPFVDVATVLDGFEADGLPFCLDATVTSPPGTEPESFLEVPPFAEIASEEARVILQALTVFAPIARAWGFPTEMLQAGDPMFFSLLQQAGIRAMAVQARKAEGA